MGQRANLALVQDKSYELYYTHWGASDLPRSIFWGAEEAVDYIRSCERIDSWLDDRWAEGGAVLDLDHRQLLWFGGDDLIYDIPLRRQFIRLMEPLWPSWEIRWATAGIAELAAYVQHPLDQIVTGYELDWEGEQPFEPEPQDGFTRTIGTVILPNGELRIYPLQCEAMDYLAAGPSQLKQIDPKCGFKELEVQNWTSDFPDMGFHLDLRKQNIDLWHAAPYSDLAASVQSRWEDWKFTGHGNRYEIQTELTAHRLKFHVKPAAELISEVVEYLLGRSASGSESAAWFAQAMSDKGHEVEVNPRAVVREQGTERSADLKIHKIRSAIRALGEKSL